MGEITQTILCILGLYQFRQFNKNIDLGHVSCNLQHWQQSALMHASMQLQRLQQAALAHGANSTLQAAQNIQLGAQHMPLGGFATLVIFLRKLHLKCLKLVPQSFVWGLTGRSQLSLPPKQRGLILRGLKAGGLVSRGLALSHQSFYEISFSGDEKSFITLVPDPCQSAADTAGGGGSYLDPPPK